MTEDTTQPLVTHLIELRNRLLRGVIAVLVFAVALLPFSNDLYQFLAAPLLQYLPEGSSMIATQVAAPFITPFKLTLSCALLLAAPVLLHQIWAFVAPGLYKNERKLALPLLFSSIALFFIGMIFVYFVVFPLMFQFFVSAAPDNVKVMTDMSAYLDFVLKLFFAFGVAFEIPVATILLVRMGVTSTESLRQKRPYIIVGAFVVGMLLTPPDVISQTLLALPVWLLFEVGLLAADRLNKKQDKIL